MTILPFQSRKRGNFGAIPIFRRYLFGRSALRIFSVEMTKKASSLIKFQIKYLISKNFLLDKEQTIVFNFVKLG